MNYSRKNGTKLQFTSIDAEFLSTTHFQNFFESAFKQRFWGGMIYEKSILAKAASNLITINLTIRSTKLLGYEINCNKDQ